MLIGMESFSEENAVKVIFAFCLPSEKWTTAIWEEMLLFRIEPFSEGLCLQENNVQFTKQYFLYNVGSSTMCKQPLKSEIRNGRQ